MITKYQGHAVVMRETDEKLQLAMDALFRVKEAMADPNVRPFRGLPEAY